MNWIEENIGTIIVSIIIATVLALAIRSLIRQKRNGRSCCGSCGSCPGCGSCDKPGRMK
ncbi:MAG: FeoB-associated Cys-rich membrane protein [Lachnospiraceae bacterium]|nr:FeoB-associated Cys-rich membrane protein [Lachnospiraceae bacterium]